MSFASDISRGNIAIPEVLGKEEAEYYRLYSAPPQPPQEGTILLQRVPFSRIMKITTANQESHRFMHGPNFGSILEGFGVPADKVTAVSDYVWSFYNMYVKVNPVPIQAALNA